MEIHVLSGTWITNSSSVGFKLGENVGTRNGTVTLISRFTLENRNEIHRQKISTLNFSIKQAGNLAYPVRCQLRSRVSPAAAVEFFIRGG